MVNDFLRRYDSFHRMIDEIPLSRLILNVTEAYSMNRGRLNTFMFGLLLTPAAKYDTQFNELMRNELFEVQRRTRKGLCSQKIDVDFVRHEHLR